MIEAAEKRCKEEIKAQRSKEANASKELEKKIREDHEDKMEYWVIITLLILRCMG